MPRHRDEPCCVLERKTHKVLPISAQLQHGENWLEMAGAKIIDTHSWHWLSVGPGEKGGCSILIKELQSDPTFFPAGQLENWQNGQQFFVFLRKTLNVVHLCAVH